MAVMRQPGRARATCRAMVAGAGAEVDHALPGRVAGKIEQARDGVGGEMCEVLFARIGAGQVWRIDDFFFELTQHLNTHDCRSPTAS